MFFKYFLHPINGYKGAGPGERKYTYIHRVQDHIEMSKETLFCVTILNVVGVFLFCLKTKCFKISVFVDQHTRCSFKRLEIRIKGC